MHIYTPVVCLCNLYTLLICCHSLFLSVSILIMIMVLGGEPIYSSNIYHAMHEPCAILDCTLQHNFSMLESCSQPSITQQSCRGAYDDVTALTGVVEFCGSTQVYFTVKVFHVTESDPFHRTAAESSEHIAQSDMGSSSPNAWW